MVYVTYIAFDEGDPVKLLAPYADQSNSLINPKINNVDKGVNLTNLIYFSQISLIHRLVPFFRVWIVWRHVHLMMLLYFLRQHYHMILSLVSVCVNL